MKPISAVDWITSDSVPTVVAYGAHDRVQPFKASLRLKAALEESGVTISILNTPTPATACRTTMWFYKKWLKTVEVYLDKYIPSGLR